MNIMLIIAGLVSTTLLAIVSCVAVFVEFLKSQNQNLAKRFGETFGNILPLSRAISLPHKNISLEITYTILSDIFIFVRNFEYCGKILERFNL